MTEPIVSASELSIVLAHLGLNYYEKRPPANG